MRIEEIEKIGRFLRAEWYDAETFEGWPGLPDQPRIEPTIEGANFFFLACLVDWQEKTWKVYQRVRRFCDEVLPPGQLSRLWDWIAGHSEEEWRRHKQDYGLHWLAAGHNRLHRIARTIRDQFQGDPRIIWTAAQSPPLLSRLNDNLRVGPGLSRMIIGALRDHQLINLRRSDYKPDIHVRAFMHDLGLSPTTKTADVLEAASLFQDPWVADTAIYHLRAELGLRTEAEFDHYYEQMSEWQRTRSQFQNRLFGAKSALSAKLDSTAWELLSDHSSHWVGFDLVRQNGPLASVMQQDDPCPLWAWIGVGFYGEIVGGTAVGGLVNYFDPPIVREALRECRFSEERVSLSCGSRQTSWWRQDGPIALRDLTRILRRESRYAVRVLSSIEQHMRTEQPG